MGVRVNGRSWNELLHPRDPAGQFTDAPGGGSDRHGTRHQESVHVQAATADTPARTQAQRIRELDRMSDDELRPLAERYRPHIWEDYDGEPPRSALRSTILNGERRAGLIRDTATGTPATRAQGVTVIDAREASQAEADFTDAVTQVTRREHDLIELPIQDLRSHVRQILPDYQISSNMSRQWLAGVIVGEEQRQRLLPDLSTFRDRVPERRRRTIISALDREERARRRARPRG